VIALGGGKGGVGKTFLAANLAAALAELGLSVAAVDTDLEGANLHTWLGVPSPRASLADFTAGRESDPAKLLLETAVPGVGLIAATHGHLDSAQPTGARRVELLKALRRLPADVAVLDCGAGAHRAVVDYFLSGDDGVLVLHAEPTSVENAYGFLKAAFYRRLQLAMLESKVRDRIREAMDQRNERGIRTPLDLLREVQSLDPEEGRRFVAAMRSFRPQIVVNEVQTAEDVKLGFAVRSVCRKYFGIEAEYAGYVNRDAAVRNSIQKRRPVVITNPRSDAAVYLRRIASKLAEPVLARPRARA
jgi:flagellar biosynthesis protein FlhG